MPANLVSYEVTVRLHDPETGDEFADWMRQEHIPDVLATGLFTAADFAALDATTFRTRYLMASRANLERYLAEHAPGLREEFTRRFGGRATASREVWNQRQAWP